MSRELDYQPAAPVGAIRSPESYPRGPWRGETWRASWNGTDLLLLLALLIVGTLFHAAHVDATPSADEVWHLALTRGEGSPYARYAFDTVYASVPPIDSLKGAAPTWKVWTSLDGILHPPLYLIILRLWRDVFGDSVGTAHALSLAWSVVALALVFDTARLTLGRHAAIWATLLMAVAPIQVYFAQEIRGYEQMIALGALVLWLAARIESFGQTPRRAALLAASLVPLVLTHYFAAGAAVAVVGWGLVRLRGRPRVAFLITVGAAAAFCATAWLPFALRQLRFIGTGDAFLKQPHFDIQVELPLLLAAPVRLFIERPLAATGVGRNLAMAGGFAIFAVPFFLSRRPAIVTLWSLCLILPVACLFVLDATRSTTHLFFVRYFAAASPAAFLLAVALIARLGRATLTLAGVVLAAMLALAYLPNGGVGGDAPSFGPTTAWLAANAAPGQAVIAVEGAGGEQTVDLLVMSLAGEPGLFPRPLAKLRDGLTPEQWRGLPDQAWVVLVDSDPSRAEQVMGGATALESYGIPEQGTCILYDLRPAKRGATTRGEPHGS